MTSPVLNNLRTSAQQLAGSLPPLLAQAEQLAQTMTMGGHGRRRAGRGEDFWQYRPAQIGDPVRAIDWRRSARSDETFVREKEWQAAQTVMFWIDRHASMSFTSASKYPAKFTRASVLTLALSILLTKGSERVGMCAGDLAPRNDRSQILRMAQTLSSSSQAFSSSDFPKPAQYPAQSRAVFMADFLSPMEPMTQAVTQAAERGVTGVLYQILDPAEEAFPYQGRTIFTSMTGDVQYEVQRAGDVRHRYLDRLAERKEALSDLARRSGWRFGVHHTDACELSALLWLYAGLEGPK